MINNRIFIVAAILCCFVQANSQVANDGWTYLFNGKDLTGFRQLNGKAIYEVKNGEIVGTNVDKEPNSFLATNENYGDFILELELFVDPAMNSGVQFRSQSLASFKEGRVHGYQMEIDPSERAWSGAIFDEGRRGWLYTTDLNPAAKTAFKNNQWNKYRIECFGSTIRTWVNGVPAAHLIDNMTPEGFIALQVHAVRKNESPGKQIRWRNIRIKTKDIKPSPYDDIFVVNLLPNNLSAQEKKNGFELLWDGKTSMGWKGATTNLFPINWKIKDGALSTTNATSAKREDLVSNEEFGAFELKFDFKVTTGASSGVLYLTTAGNGLEFQIVDEAKRPDSVVNHKLASLYGLIASNITDERFIRKAGEWNEAVIKVSPDKKVEYWLNSMKVLEFKRGSQEFLNLVKQSEFGKLNNFGTSSKGHILLQDEGGEVSFRSIKVRRLK